MTTPDPWEVKHQFMPAWISQALLDGYLRPRSINWWIHGFDLKTADGLIMVKPGDELVQDEDGVIGRLSSPRSKPDRAPKSAPEARSKP